MYNQYIGEDILYLMFYAGVTVLNLIACCYLLFRRSNAIAPDVTPPVRLRRWTAAFFAAAALSHLWNLPMYIPTSGRDVMLSYLVGGLLDCLTVGPLAFIILFALLQDRRRPLWPAWLMTAPPVVIMALSVATHSYDFLPLLYGYFLPLSIGLIIYMVRAVRQYGRWLRDNYADLEYKEVWHSFVVLALTLLGLGIYTFTVEGLALEYVIQLIDVVLVCYLVWRVETLSDLSVACPLSTEREPAAEDMTDEDLSSTAHDKIGVLLQRHCIDTQLFLQHNLTIHQLATAVGTNRSYLSQYFSRQGTTYNAYINGLRIDHFVGLYRQAVAAKQHITVRQMAQNSGYRNYTTFSNAFKQRMGKNVTAWMQDGDGEHQSSEI